VENGLSDLLSKLLVFNGLQKNKRQIFQNRSTFLFHSYPSLILVWFSGKVLEKKSVNGHLEN